MPAESGVQIKSERRPEPPVRRVCLTLSRARATVGDHNPRRSWRSVRAPDRQNTCDTSGTSVLSVDRSERTRTPPVDPYLKLEAGRARPNGLGGYRLRIEGVLAPTTGAVARIESSSFSPTSEASAPCWDCWRMVRRDCRLARSVVGSTRSLASLPTWWADGRSVERGLRFPLPEAQIALHITHQTVRTDEP